MKKNCILTHRIREQQCLNAAGIVPPANRFSTISKTDVAASWLPTNNADTTIRL